MDVCVARAYACMRRDDLDGASALFEQALEKYPQHARSWLGLADVRYRQGRRGDTESALSRGLDAVDSLRAQGRGSEAALAAATAELIAGRPASAVGVLDLLLANSPAATAGWTIPIEPAFAPLANSSDPAFKSVLDKLADRAQ